METAQKAINMHMRSSHTSSGGKSSKGRSGLNPHEKKESGSSSKGDGPKYVKKGDTIYHRKTRFPSKREGKGGMNHQTKGHQTQTNDKGAQPRKFLLVITCYRCGKEGHMANQCNQPCKDGWKGPAKNRLFAAEVQEEVQEQSNDVEDLAENVNEEVVNETPQDERENSEEVTEDLKDAENKQFDYYEENSEVEDDDEPVAFYSTMHHEEGSSQDENIVRCAMMHKDELPELEGLSISQPVQQEWEWSCQYGAMHQEYCEECNHHVQHVGLAL